MHTVRLLLSTTEYDKQVLEKRFRAVSHIHNVLVKHARKCLKKTEYSRIFKKSKSSKEDKVCKKQLSQKMTDIIRSYGLSEYSFQAYIKVCAKQFRKCLSSQQVQKESTRVWRGVEDILYGDGKELHFKKCRDFNTICGK